MSHDFKPFSQAIHARLNQLSEHELYVTNISGDELYAHYLASFPEGTNPIYRKRTEHDCSCCKNFIRNFGNVVAIIDGKMQSIWLGLDTAKLEHPYDVVAENMDALVCSKEIVSLFRTKEPKYGAEQTKQLLEDGTVKNWNHFHGTVAKRHFTDMPDKARGDFNTKLGVFKRGLEELSPSAIQTVLDLIDGKQLYRGEEHLRTVKGFQAAQTDYLKLDSFAARELFIWTNGNSPAVQFRNTVIGTLVQDLSEGKPLEAAVKSFEDKVAPTNYKRTTALITPRMVEDAMKTINELGLEPALERRFAKLSDVSVNNVLWVNNDSKAQMKGGIAGKLMSVATATPVKDVNAEDISIADFMANILPKAQTIDMLVKNKHVSNLMSLTAPVHADAAQLFKWDNGFAWSYNGNIADSDIRQAVAAKGGRVDGVFRFSHQWNYGKRNASLMDLHVFMPGSGIHTDGMHDRYPSGRRVGWNERNDRASGGIQDVDYTSAAPEGYIPVENITFPDLKKMPEGVYLCKIHNWQLRAPTQGGFRAEIEFEGQVFEYEVDRPLKHKEWVTVAAVTLKDGKFTIEHKLPCQQASQDIWGIKTEQFVKVNTLMYSPNFWDGQAMGNKHWFFMLDGCKNDAPARGIYNEFLKGELDKHRKVFEILGNQTKCPVTDDQLSGLGFSSTRGDKVTVRVQTDKRQQVLNIVF